MKRILVAALAALTLAACHAMTPAKEDGGDALALAGIYAGVLPCADCPGIDETLVLGADGSFVLTDVYRERPGSTHVVHGNWSVDGGNRIRLDLDGKDRQDRLFAMEGSDSLVMLDAEGKRIDSPFDQRLVREK